MYRGHSVAPGIFRQYVSDMYKMENGLITRNGE